MSFMNNEYEYILTLGTYIRDVAKWSIIEPALGIIAGSLATFGPLVHKRRQATTYGAH